MTITAFVSRLEPTPLTIIVSGRAPPELLRACLRAACSQRRSVVTYNPSLYLASVIKHLAHRSPSVGVVAGESDQSADFTYTLYSTGSYPLLAVEQRDRAEPLYDGPFFAWLGSKRRYPPRLTQPPRLNHSTSPELDHRKSEVRAAFAAKVQTGRARVAAEGYNEHQRRLREIIAEELRAVGAAPPENPPAERFGTEPAPATRPIKRLGKRRLRIDFSAAHKPSEPPGK